MICQAAVSLLICTLAGCGTSQGGQENSVSSVTAETVFETLAERTEPVKEMNVINETVPGAAKEAAETAKSSSVLVVYFSRWGNTDYPDNVDASTSASIVMDQNEKYGTTEYAARFIGQATGGDFHRIETVQPYTEDFNELVDVNHDEKQRGFLPELKESSLDLTNYDTVFVGYPVWASNVPQAVLSFLNQYDLSGKMVIPFCTHDGYGAGSSYRTVAEACQGADVRDGIAVEAEDVPGAEDTIKNWLSGMGMYIPAETDSGSSGPQSQGETPILITIGGRTLDGILYDTALAEEIKG